eukprot:TRINITY_DN2006_c0_g1_i1.p1 TRINITY_DN2006_c0_g1~~TRINITY_DN2006_c0_g1_i1.p1  ORF type:complete len:311 (+),score=70.62 TRINITY_DN2006_c0_g1_i1:304-1236(+)
MYRGIMSQGDDQSWYSCHLSKAKSIGEEIDAVIYYHKQFGEKKQIVEDKSYEHFLMEIIISPQVLAQKFNGATTLENEDKLLEYILQVVTYCELLNVRKNEMCDNILDELYLILSCISFILDCKKTGGFLAFLTSLLPLYKNLIADSLLYLFEEFWLPVPVELARIELGEEVPDDTLVIEHVDWDIGDDRKNVVDHFEGSRFAETTRVNLRKDKKDNVVDPKIEEEKKRLEKIEKEKEAMVQRYISQMKNSNSFYSNNIDFRKLENPVSVPKNLGNNKKKSITSTPTKKRKREETTEPPPKRRRTRHVAF